jgi:hypothetical protein
MKLNVSIVVYKHAITEVSALVDLLQKSGVVAQIFLVDNSPQPNEAFAALTVN